MRRTDVSWQDDNVRAGRGPALVDQVFETICRGWEDQAVDRLPTLNERVEQVFADLAALGGVRIHESFEDGVAWQDSRNSISNPGRTAAVMNQGLLWTSNDAQNEIATGDVG